NAVAFKFDTEFAIVPVGDTVQTVSKLESGIVFRPWFSFKFCEVTSQSPSITFDGTSITSASDITIHNHKSNEVVFGGNPAKTNSAKGELGSL
ncbi:hypothetical protein BGZ65_009312, partial [Modicella reniformis]